jgi:hypothetical protein
MTKVCSFGFNAWTICGLAKKCITAILLGLLCHSSARASLCRASAENAGSAANVDVMLSWAHSPANGVGVSGVVKLVAPDDASAGSLHGLVTTSFGSDNWEWREQTPGLNSNVAADAMLPEPVSVALALFALCFVIPRARQWKRRLPHDNSTKSGAI